MSVHRPFPITCACPNVTCYKIVNPSYYNQTPSPNILHSLSLSLSKNHRTTTIVEHPLCIYSKYIVHKDQFESLYRKQNKVPKNLVWLIGGFRALIVSSVPTFAKVEAEWWGLGFRCTTTWSDMVPPINMWNPSSATTFTTLRNKSSPGSKH